MAFSSFGLSPSGRHSEGAFNQFDRATKLYTDENGVEHWQGLDGQIFTNDPNKSSTLDKIVKGLAIAGVGAGFGAAGASALGLGGAGAVGGSAGDAALAGGGGTDALAGGAASIPDAASLITPQVLGAGSFGGGFAPDALTLGVATGSGFAGLSPAALAALGVGGAGTAIGSQLASMPTPSMGGASQAPSNAEEPNAPKDGNSPFSNLSFSDLLRLGSLAGLVMQPGGSAGAGAAPQMPMGPSLPQPQMQTSPFQFPNLMNFDRPGQGNMYGNATSIGGLAASPFGMPNLMNFNR